MTNGVADKISCQIDALVHREGELMSEIADVRGRVRGLRDALAMVQGDESSAIDGGVEAHQQKGVSQAKRNRGDRLPNPETNARWAYMLLLLQSAPTGGRSIDEIVRLTNEHGHALTPNVARSFLSIAAKRGICRRVATGRYCIANTNGSGNVTIPEPSENQTEAAGMPVEFPRQDSPVILTASNTKRDLLSGTARPVSTMIAADRR